MKKLTLTLIIFAAAMSFGPGCKPPPPPPEEAVASCVPYDVGGEVNDGSIVVSFKSDCTSLINGYNIYVSREPLAQKYPGPDLPADIKPNNQPVFPGDTDPSDHIEHYEAEGVENGVTYYVHVRTMFPDRSLSKPSNEIAVVPGPRGQIELTVRYKSDHDGWSFPMNDYVRADAVDNDMYVFVKDGKYYLASPDRLGFLRKTQFRLLPYKGEVDEVSSKLSGDTRMPSDDRVQVSEDDWVELMTADKTFALLKVIDIVGKGDDARLKLFYAWTPKVGAPAF